MKHSNKKFLWVVLVAGLAATGCKKNFLDVNADPNRTTDANVTPELIFTQAEAAVGGRQASGDFGFLDQWIGYFAQNGDFAPQQNLINYNIDFTFGNTLFSNNYNVLFDLKLAEQKGLVSGDTSLVGASMILSAKLWQETVDLFGNIPYKQAFQVGTYPTPAYDKAQDIYNDLQLVLDTAIGYMQLTQPKKFAPADIINAGDATLWIAFANTLKLRLLIRQSEISGFDPTAELAKITATGGVLMAGQNISVNPGYVNDVNKQNPFYAGFGFDPTGIIASTSTNANEYITDIFGATADPRLSRFFYPVGYAGSTYVGDKFGDATENLPTGAQSSYFGPALIGTLNSSNKGDGTGAVQNQWIYPAFESMFLYAEAVARGWFTGPTPSDAYNAALRESFVWLGVENIDSALPAYIAANPTIADYTTVAGSSVDDQARFIDYQKYLSLVGIDPLEAYSDQRRLDILQADDSYISISPARLSNTIPVRLLYPQSEYTTNNANVQAQGTINSFTSKLFWQTN